jgi:hypothetical protein
MALVNHVADIAGSSVLARAGKAIQTGTTAEHAAYTGEQGELTYDTDLERLIVHDGVTAGGLVLDAAAAAEVTFAAGLATVATLGVPVKVVAVTTAKGDASGFTVGTDNTLTATFVGTKLCRVYGRFDVDVAAAADALTLHVFVNGASAFETAAQTVTALTLKQFEIDVLLEITGGDTIEIYGENEDTTANIITAAASEALDLVPAHGFLQVTSV